MPSYVDDLPGYLHARDRTMSNVVVEAELMIPGYVHRTYARPIDPDDIARDTVLTWAAIEMPLWRWHACGGMLRPAWYDVIGMLRFAGTVRRVKRELERALHLRLVDESRHAHTR